jgi:hypothetical protein
MDGTDFDPSKVLYFPSIIGVHQCLPGVAFALGLMLLDGRGLPALPA